MKGKWFFNLKIEVNGFKRVGNCVTSVDLNVILTESFCMEKCDVLVIIFPKLDSPFASRSCPVSWGGQPASPHQPFPLSLGSPCHPVSAAGFVFFCCNSRGPLSFSSWKFCPIGLLICLELIYLPALTSWLLILADIQLVLSIFSIISKKREQRCPTTYHISPRQYQVIHFIDSGPKVDKCLPQHYFRHSNSNGEVSSCVQKSIKFLILYFNQVIFSTSIATRYPPQYYYEINN